MDQNEHSEHRGLRIASPVMVAAAVATVFWVSAGDLDPPPGAILPTNRVQLNAQMITLPHTISQPGSCVLTSELIGSSGQNGIVIDADDVTLDLNGFALVGVTGSLDGVHVNGAHSNIAIGDGIVRDWGAQGINASAAVNSRFDALSIGNCGNNGVELGSNSIVRGLSVTGNTLAGIGVVGDGNRIEGNHVTDNGVGVDVDGTENLIVKNSARGNTTGYDIAAGNSFGPIVSVGAVGDITAVANADHPWANFVLTCIPSAEICDGIDNDCNPGTADGSDETWFGDPCDGTDSDLCEEGVYGCIDGSQTCNDNTGNNLDLCNGADDDCNSATADGSDDPGLGNPCDGSDTDLCEEGVYVCSDGSLSCNDATGNILDLCNGVDDDCNAATADGSDDPGLGNPCDGLDTDLCEEGVTVCSEGSLTCNDNTGNTLDLCDRVDNDCNTATADGYDEPWLGDDCDGYDTDLCEEGVYTCSGGYQTCSDTTGNNVEICNGLDDDCDTVIDEGVCPNGTACTSSIVCQSGNCVDDVCCNSSCGGVCAACDLAGSVGTCTLVPLGEDPDSECFDGEACDGAGGCCTLNAQTCSGSAECCSNNCVDGVCCNNSCTGLCEACDLSGTEGTCTLVPLATDPDDDCLGPELCDGTGGCCKANGQSCSDPSQCCSGNCTSDSVCSSS